MKRPLLFALLAALALFTAACEDDGELRLRNRTASDVWASVDDSEPRDIPGWANWSRFYASERTATVTYSGNYVFANSVTREVRPNLVSTVDISPDGGAVEITNDGTKALTEVYISVSGDPNWGSDDLAGTIPPGEIGLWTVTQGDWDIKVVDIDGETHYKYAQSVVTNATLGLLLSNFGKYREKLAYHGDIYGK